MHGAIQDQFKIYWKENQHRFPKGADQTFMKKLVGDNFHLFAQRLFEAMLWKANHELTQSAPKPKEGGH